MGEVVVEPASPEMYPLRTGFGRHRTPSPFLYEESDSDESDEESATSPITQLQSRAASNVSLSDLENLPVEVSSSFLDDLYGGSALTNV